MANYSDNDPVWLVKSAGSILGPFSLIDLTQVLKDRKVALLDEVRTPTSRWSFIRENEKLADLVRVIREAEARQNMTTGKTRLDSEPDEGEATQSLSVTLRVIETTPVNLGSDDLTVPVSVPAESMPSAVAAKTGDKKIKAPVVAIPQNWNVADKPEETSLSRRALVYLVLLICIVGGTAGYLWANREPKKITGPKLNPGTELLGLAKRSKNLGFYDRSLMMYERALAAGATEPNIKYELVPLLLLDPRNFSQAQGLIHELSANLAKLPAGAPQKLDNWAGMLMMKQNQFPAAEVSLKIAADKYGNPPAVQINRMINFFFSGQADNALQLAKSLIDQGVKDPLVTLTQGLTLLTVAPDKFNAAGAQSVFTDLSKWMESRRDLLFESLLVNASLADRLGNTSVVTDLMDHLVNQTAGITHQFAHDLDMDYGVISWSHLKPLCDDLVKHYEKLPKALALNIQCEIESENSGRVEAEIQNGLQKFPGDQYLLGLKAAYLKIQGHPHEALELLKNIRTRPALLMRSQLCIDDKDLLCVEESIRLLAEKDRNDVENIYQLTQLNLLKDKRDFAEQFAEKGLKLAPKYKPLMEIREEMGEL